MSYGTVCIWWIWHLGASITIEASQTQIFRFSQTFLLTIVPTVRKEKPLSAKDHYSSVLSHADDHCLWRRFIIINGSFVDPSTETISFLHYDLAHTHCEVFLPGRALCTLFSSLKLSLVAPCSRGTLVLCGKWRPWRTVMSHGAFISSQITNSN